MTTVLYLEPGSGFGGSAHSLYQLLRGLDRQRFRPIVAASCEGSAIKKICELGVPVMILGDSIERADGYGRLLRRWLWREWPRALRLARLIRREGVDVMHLNTDIYSTVAGLWAAALCRTPVVSHIRLTRSPTCLERWLGRWVRVKIVLTQEAERFYRRWWPGDRFEWVPNGVEIPDGPAPDRDVLRERLRVPAGKQVVGLIARCVPGKGYEEFLKAAEIASQRLADVSFIIFGNGQGGEAAYERTVRRYAHTLGLNGQVIWGGWQSDPQAIYSLLDIVVQASSTFPEGMPRVTLEAMAYRRPVIATDIVGNRELVVHQRTGLLVTPGSAQALAEAIITLLQDPNLARSYGEQGRQRAEALFSLNAHARRIERLYESLVSR